MTQERIWRLLDIAATNDGSEIRRAYARKLKQLNIDADPAAYAALREARDTALRLAASLTLAGAEEEPVLADDGMPESPAEEPAVPTADDPIGRHQQALLALLFPGEEHRDVPLSVNEAAELRDHFDALLTDSRLQDIGTFGDASEWFGAALAQGYPRSTSLLEPAAAFFQWQAQSEISRSPAVAWLMNIIEGEQFVRAVEAPGHPLHKAWVELMRPAPANAQRGWLVSRKKILTLIGQIRARHPHLEQRFDWYRVSIWETRTRCIVSFGKVFIGGWIILWLANALWFSHTSPPGLPSAPYSGDPAQTQLRDVDADIDHVLRNMIDEMLTGSMIRGNDPRLYNVLVDSWNAGRRASGTLASFAYTAGQTIDWRYQQDLAHGSYPLLSEHFRLMLREGEIANKLGALQCAQYFEGAHPALELPDDLRHRRRSLIGRALLENGAGSADVEAPHRIRFRIPGAVVQKVLTRTGLTSKQFATALQELDVFTNRCSANQALVEAVLGLPKKQGLKTMRAMMGNPAP